MSHACQHRRRPVVRVRVWLAAVLAVATVCTGCSWVWRDAHSGRYGGHVPASAADCPSYVWAGLDGVGTAGLGYLTTVAVIHRNDADSAANIFILPGALFTLFYASSVVYGLWMPGHCKRRFDPPPSGGAATPRTISRATAGS